MVWLERYPKKGRREIAPIPQSIEVNYREREGSLIRYPLECKAVLDLVSSATRGVGTIRLTGSLAISMATQTFPRIHTNTDLALLLQEDPLMQFLAQAEEHRRYPFSRIRSWKVKPWGDYKHETFMPCSGKTLMKQKKRNLNFMLCEVDENGNIIPSNTIFTRWRIYGYKEVEGLKRLYCPEDGSSILPAWFNGSYEYRNPEGQRIRSVSKEMLLEIEENVMRQSKNPKHQEDVLRLQKMK
jgi:hypothetical protein